MKGLSVVKEEQKETKEPVRLPAKGDPDGRPVPVPTPPSKEPESPGGH